MSGQSGPESLVTWVRLFDGRLWHAMSGSNLTWCGRTIESKGESRAERLPGRVPVNAWACDRCVRAIHGAAAAAKAVWLSDPRRRSGDRLPDPEPIAGRSMKEETPRVGEV